jgi:alkaline phosphatase
MVAACAAPQASASPSASRALPSSTPTASVRPSPTPPAEPTSTPEAPVALIAAGDIASCDEDADSASAALVEELEGTVASLGDSVYPAGSDATFAQCYDPVWGEFLDRTRPAIGNHDMQDDGGDAYYRYFGDRAGTAGEGWYSYELGGWHVIVLNSNCEVIGCAPGSAQHDWLLADLAASNARCTLAYWHHPRFSSGPHGDYQPVAPLWEAVAGADTALVLVGHDHLYERFAPRAADGSADQDGVRQFTVGTGGKALYAAQRVAPNSELIIDDAFGVLELTLHADAYDWRFLTVDGTEADAGSGDCH